MKLSSIAVAATLLLVTTAASADETAKRCVAQSDEGQYLRDHGKLTQARASFVACAQTECPSVVRRACAEWLQDVDARLPSVVISLRDDKGKDISGQLRMDGERVDQPSGRALTVDPGFHVFEGVVPGKPKAQVQLLVKEGEKNVPIALVVAPPPKPVAPPPEKRVPVMSVVLGGVALASGAVSLGFWRDAVSEGDNLRGSCAPGCTDDEIAPVERSLLVSRVALGVGIAAAIGAVTWFFVAPGRAPKPTAQGFALTF